MKHVNFGNIWQQGCFASITDDFIRIEDGKMEACRRCWGYGDPFKPSNLKSTNVEYEILEVFANNSQCGIHLVPQMLHFTILNYHLKTLWMVEKSYTTLDG